MILELYILLVLLILIQPPGLIILDQLELDQRYLQLELDPQPLLELLRKEAVNKILPFLIDLTIKVIKGQHIGTLNQTNMQPPRKPQLPSKPQSAQIYWNDEWNLSKPQSTLTTNKI